MGCLRPILFASLLGLAAGPAHAQQGNSGAPVLTLPGSSPRPASDSRRQGPELDVYRDDGTPPPITPTPTVIVPTVPQPKPGAARPAPARQSQVARPRPARPRAQAPAVPPALAKPERQLAPKPAETERAVPVPRKAPVPKAAPVRPPPVAEPVPRNAPAKPLAWPWIGVAVLILLGALTILLRRRRWDDVAQDEPVAADIVPVEPAPRSEAVPPPLPVTQPSPPTASPLPASKRPWIEIGMEVRAARMSLIGATVSYTLSLHNRGDAPAQDIVVRALIANADAGPLIQQFFGGDAGQPVHSVAQIAPGESQRLAGELRLDVADIAPVQVGKRALLVPLLAFDAHYRWADDAGEPKGAGRAARAFIVGQEQDPPTERLAPFRLDLGPRQFRGAAARATALERAS